MTAGWIRVPGSFTSPPRKCFGEGWRPEWPQGSGKRRVALRQISIRPIGCYLRRPAAEWQYALASCFFEFWGLFSPDPHQSVLREGS